MNPNPKRMTPIRGRRKGEAPLSDMQKAFCRFYVSHGNATEAARQAGYSRKSVRQIGSEHLHRPQIQEEIKRLEARKLAQVEKILSEANADAPPELLREAAEEGAAILTRAWVVVRQIRALQTALGEIPAHVSRMVVTKEKDGTIKRERVDLEMYVTDLTSANRAAELLHREVDRMTGENTPGADQPAEEFAKTMAAFREALETREKR